MHLALTLLHVSAMSVWLAGLFFLPRLCLAQARGPQAEQERMAGLAARLYRGVMTPAAILTVAFGLALIGWGFEGAWLPAKLLLVAATVLLHVYQGSLLARPGDVVRHRPLLYRLLGWAPLLLVLAIAALAAAKPRALPPLGGV